jgi:hypothetical protein
MKKALFIIATCFASSTLFAQSRSLDYELSLGLENSLPVQGFMYGDTKYTNYGLGATAQFAYNFDKTAAITFQSGIISYFIKNLTGRNINMRQIPSKAGIRFNIENFYIEPQLGVSIFYGNLPLPYPYNTEALSATAFTYAGNIGIFVSRSFDISLRYEGWATNNSSVAGEILGLRLAYIFTHRN